MSHRMPHVLMIPAWWPSPEQPGAGSFNVDLARVLIASGFRVGVVFPDLVSLRHLGQRGQLRRLPGLVRRGLSYEHIDRCPGSAARPEEAVPSVLRVRGLVTAFGSPRRYMGRYADWCRQGFEEYSRCFGRPDVLHAMCAIPAGWAALQFKLPLVVTEHTGPFALALQPAAAGEMTRAALTQADAVVAVSDHLADQMRNAGIHRAIEVIGNPLTDDWSFTVPPALEAGAEGRRVVKVAFVGRLTAEKGVAELADAALRLVADSAFRFVWHVVGDGPRRSHLAATLGGLISCGEALLHGELPRAAARRVMADCHLLALPSHGETFGMVVAEAMALGRPVVVARGTACEAMVSGSSDAGGCGVVCNSRDGASLAAAVRQAAARWGEWDFFGISRYARGQWGGDAIAARYRGLYERVMSRTARKI